jgi:hypothetical protein
LINLKRAVDTAVCKINRALRVAGGSGAARVDLAVRLTLWSYQGTALLPGRAELGVSPPLSLVVVISLETSVSRRRAVENVAEAFVDLENGDGTERRKERRDSRKEINKIKRIQRSARTQGICHVTRR